MANNDLGKRFFTNTYVTGGGRQNYLRIDHLEDPLFTSFTLDIDFISSPLFYTINSSDYGYPNVEGLGENIEAALDEMHKDLSDDGYDILPQLSASILDDNKLGFGIQQNVYMDMPLYGATEYIYMVDKRNGAASQNDVRYDSNRFVEYGGSPNELNGYKLGDSLKSIVNDSDKAWAERQKEQNEAQISACSEIMSNNEIVTEHESNKSEMETLISECNSFKGEVVVDGKTIEYTEAELQDKVNEYKKFVDGFEQLKREIADWVNGILSQYRNNLRSIYSSNKCIQKISKYEDINNGGGKVEKYFNELESLYGDDFVKEYIYEDENSYFDKILTLYNELETYSYSPPSDCIQDDGKSFLLEKKSGDGKSSVRTETILSYFGDKLEYFDLYKKGEESSFKVGIKVQQTIEPEEWMLKVEAGVKAILGHAGKTNRNYILDLSNYIMKYECDIDDSFENFTSKKFEENTENLGIYEDALEGLRIELYGTSPTGEINNISNPSPDSPYGQYLAAKEKYENDDYSQAEKAQSLAQSGVNEMTKMLDTYENQQNINENNYNKSIQMDAQPFELNKNTSVVASQTVLDMLGFISGMKKMVQHYPYIIQSVTGLDTAYKNHYFIKDPYLGSGDDKITLTCFESLDLRVSSMFNRYFNAIYDRQYRRERVPINLRRFNCTIYVHDVRNFVSRMRFDERGNQKTTYNRLLELTDMYYSVIEFRFYDCEIVPEETGNIFDSISNEAPSDMKKTNFTFKYGNCVVNFVPQSEVAAHNSEN